MDGTEYKEYEVVLSDQPLGVIAWHGDGDPSTGPWYTVASDGAPRYFQTQAEVVDFLRDSLQQTTVKPLGSYLVEAGLLTQAQLNLALATQAGTGVQLGKILVEQGWIKPQTIEYLMEKVIQPERAR